MKAKKILSLVLCMLMLLSAASLMASAESDLTVYEVKNATEFNNAIAIAGRNSAIRLIANITADQTFAVIKNKEAFAIDLNGYSITGEGEKIKDFITVGNDTSLVILNSGKTRSDIIVNSAAPGTSAICVNGKNASLRILNNINVVMGTNGYYGIGNNYAHCIKVVDGSALSINGANIYNWMYWGNGISFCNYAANAFDNFTFSVSGDSEITAKVAGIDFSFTNTLPGKSYVSDCSISYETSKPSFDDGSSAPKKDFMAFKAVGDNYKLGDALAEGYIAEYVRMDVLVDYDSLIKNFPKGEDILINPCDSHSWINATCKKAKHCEYCGKTEGKPAAHTYYVVTDSSTCTAPGVKVSKCSVCGDQPTENVAAKGHNFAMVKHQVPTYAADGYKEYKCTNCTETKKDVLSNRPVTVSATQTTNQIKLTWSAVQSAESYNVYQKSGSGWKLLANVKAVEYTVKNLKAGTMYTFAVRAAWTNNGNLTLASKYSTCDTATKTVVANVQATPGANAIRLTWAKCAGATGYRIFYKVGTSTSWNTAMNSTTATTVDVKGLSSGTMYTFAVRPYVRNGNTVVWSDYKETPTATMTVKPAKVTATQTTNSVTLNWTKCAGATGYRIFVKSGSGWSVVNTTSATTYTVKNLNAGTKYIYAVRPFIKNGNTVVWSDFTQIATATKTVKPAKVTAKQTTSSVTLNWTKCAGATGYRIFVKSGSSWKTVLNSTTALTHTFTNQKAGTKYTFAIRPYIINSGNVIWSDFVEFTTATLPATVTAKASSPSKGKVNVTWDAVSGAEMYHVYYSVDNGGYKFLKTYSSVQNLNFSLKSGSKYTFAVRAGIKTPSGNVNGGYKAATVTVK
ncbi:MAG: fibronectin type III domain-containing protein [Clostridia bacterium]|nr:fibronectin type III domain-containing protein [Clostridia bacterium]